MKIQMLLLEFLLKQKLIFWKVKICLCWRSNLSLTLWVSFQCKANIMKVCLFQIVPLLVLFFLLCLFVKAFSNFSTKLPANTAYLHSVASSLSSLWSCISLTSLDVLSSASSLLINLRHWDSHTGSETQVFSKGFKKGAAEEFVLTTW